MQQKGHSNLFFVERHFLLKGRLAKSQSSDVNAQSSEPQVRLQGYNASRVAISAKRVGLWVDGIGLLLWNALLPYLPKVLAAAWRNQMGSNMPVTRTSLGQGRTSSSALSSFFLLLRGIWGQQHPTFQNPRHTLLFAFYLRWVPWPSKANQILFCSDVTRRAG